jgi:kynurenine formamidase
MNPEATNYRDLPLLPGLELPHAWEVFGRRDEVGTLNLLTPERVLAALAVASTGRVFNLSLPLNLPDPPMFGREAYRHSILTSRNGQDDYVDGFYLQGSSQWDGLRHVKAREFGFYGGVADEDAGSGGGKLGVEKWAKHGIIGRGVLLDVARHLSLKASREDPFGSYAITADLLAEVAEEQGVGFRTGDILLVRTGWMEAYLALTDEGRVQVADSRSWIGLEADAAMAEFLWDNHFAAAALDNPAVEHSPGDPKVGSLHRRMIPLLGMALGEFWNLEELAAFAAEARRFESCIVSVPLNLPGAVGSPANALALV